VASLGENRMFLALLPVGNKKRTAAPGEPARQCLGL
jgi:hypothetical protein